MLSLRCARVLLGSVLAVATSGGCASAVTPGDGGVPDASVITDEARDVAEPDAVVRDVASGGETSTDVTATPDVSLVDVGIAPDASSLCANAINLRALGRTVGIATWYMGDNSTAPLGRTFMEMCPTNDTRQVLHVFVTSRRAALRISAGDYATTFRAVVSAFTACGPAPPAIACAADANTSDGPIVTDILPAGTVVYILVGGYGTAAMNHGNYVLHVAEIPEVAVGSACDPEEHVNICIGGTRCIGAVDPRCHF